MPYVHSGLFALPWWGYVGAALCLTHVTIAAVTLYLHRSQAHRAVEFHPVVSHFFRFWLWLTTGMVTKEWVAIHRKHHACCETSDDPHSPQVYGIWRVLFAGVFLYVRESHNEETLRKHGAMTPDDWMEKNVYAARPVAGLYIMGFLDLWFFGLIPGMCILAAQIVWIPFWAAGVINGAGHYVGYRNFPRTEGNASTNIVPWGIWIGGEELHNNHHENPTGAKLSVKWWEFDLGWLYIRALESFGLAKVKRI